MTQFKKPRSKTVFEAFSLLNVKKMNKINLTIIFMSVIFTLAAQSSSATMREEADRFLQSMPDSLQDKQTAAILQAIEGDNSLLQVVRNSRNTPSPLPNNVIAEYVNSKACLYRPVGIEDPLPLLIYFHGGGWTFGSINSCSRFCANTASSRKAMVLAIDYPLAPEHPFPEGLTCCVNAVEDAFTKATEWGVDSNAIILGGDSSGGNLAIATALQLINRLGYCPIKSLLLFYPVVKAFSDNSDSWNRYGKGFALDSGIMDAFNKAYTKDFLNPLVSVALAPDSVLKKLPRTVIVAAERDILHDQGLEFFNHLKELSVGTQRITLPGTVHLFITVKGQEQAFQQAVKLTLKLMEEL